MEEFYDLQTLPNGVRIVTEHVPAVRSACLGLWVGTGSRHEKAGEGGAAHFIEHMAFKGTDRRTARQLGERLHHQGAHLLLCPLSGQPPGPGGGSAVRHALCLPL